jgi:hypothetical protein
MTCSTPSFMRACLLALGLVLGATGAYAQLGAGEVLPFAPSVRISGRPCNMAVLEAIRGMPSGGTYAASRPAFDGLTKSIIVRGSTLTTDPLLARPSFCSSATYLVFIRALEQMIERGDLSLDAATLSALQVTGQRDGQGIWGRWNANGPGTARLFTELNLGRNFCEWQEAEPGDFMKIFWTDEIGKKERGHSVVYLGSKVVSGKEYVRFWSSNLPSAAGDLSGYGEKLVPKSKMARVIFSRLETPANIAKAPNYRGTDAFLASLLSKSVSMDDVRRMCGL